MHKHCIFITSTLSFQIALGSGLCFLFFFLGFFGAGDLSAATTTITRRSQTVNVMDARRAANEQASPAIPGLLYDAGTNIKLKTHSKKLKGISGGKNKRFILIFNVMLKKLEDGLS